MRIQLNIYFVGDSKPDFTKHIDAAARIYGKGGIGITGGHPENISAAGILNPQNNKFYESQLANLVSMSNSRQAIKSIDVYYVPEFYSSDVQGVTLRPSGSDPGLYRGTAPLRPIITINTKSAAEATLAHELGHALLDSGEHSNKSNNLMAEGSKRTGTQLTSEQWQKIKQSNCLI